MLCNKLSNRNTIEIERADGNKKIPILKKYEPMLEDFSFFKLETVFFIKTLPAGFEPATHCLEGSCSIQLS